MLMRTSTYILFTKLLIISQCAPKLGPVLFDPLTLEIASHFNEIPPPEPFTGRISRDKETQAETSPEEEYRRNGYDFDEQNCKLVNNRILCGYNKNVGNNKNLTVDMGNGCQMRGDRIECGYLAGPFEGIRRPPLQADAKEAMRYLQLKADTNDSPIMKKLKTVSVMTPPADTNALKSKLRAVLLPLSNANNTSKIANENTNEIETTDIITTKTEKEPEKAFELNITTSPTIIKNESTTTPVNISLTTDSNNTTIIIINESNYTSTNATVVMDESNSSSEFLENEAVNSEELTGTRTESLTEKEETLNVTSEAKEHKTVSEAILSTITESTLKTTESLNRIKIKRRSTSENKTQPMSMTLCVEKQDRIVCFDEHFLPKKSGTLRTRP